MNAGSWSKSRLTTVAVIAILCAAGTAMAASGVSTLVTSGDDGAATAQGSGEPLGTLSARTPSGTLTPSDTPSDHGTRGEQGAGAPGGGNTQPVGDVSPSTPDATGGGSASLPFTGYLLIPILLIGTVMLGIGVALRRRSVAPPASA